MSDPLLSSLCTICHVKPYRYRCPRCSALTCSLPCIKRHKQWAQCNGVRDPTVYVKQKDLATPKGIDHDYNYLTSIERELDYAEKDATSRGVVLHEPSIKAKNKKKGEAKLEAALEQCGVIVARAPKGMTRSKQNETRVTNKSRSLVWTLEWVYPDGRKALGGCPEDKPIANAYNDHITMLDPRRPTKRRKMSHEQTEDAQSNTPVPSHEQNERAPQNLVTDETPIEAKVGGESEETNSEKANSTNLEDPKRSPHFGQEQLLLKKAVLDKARAYLEEQPPLSLPVDSISSPLASYPSATSTTDPAPPASSPELTFYLHHPSLPSQQPVLIPLSPDSILATSLANRLVLEFPTIYVFHGQPGDKLPDGFINEEHFFAMAKKESVAEVEGGEGAIERLSAPEVERIYGFEEGEVDERRLLEVLGKDLKGINGTG